MLHMPGQAGAVFFWFGYLCIQPMSMTWSLSYLINVDMIHLNKNYLTQFKYN